MGLKNVNVTMNNTKTKRGLHDEQEKKFMCNTTHNTHGEYFSIMSAKCWRKSKH